MAGNTITRVISFEHQDCITCQIVFLVPVGFTAQRRKDCATFYCPNGHQMGYSRSDTEEAKLRRERDRLKQDAARLEEVVAQQRRRAAHAEEEAAAAGRRASAARGQVTKLKKRAFNGACPCCNRTFVDLQRHMAAKHKGFLVEEVQSETGKTIQ